MANVVMPKPKRSDPAAAGMAIGAAVGGISGSGNPNAISTGAGYGSQAGSMLASKKQDPQAIETAITRRKQQLDNTPLAALRDSIDSLQYIQNPALQQELAAPLVQASMAARKRPGGF